MSAASERALVERVYVWELPVRLCHWLIFGSIVVLAVTGIYIGNPFLSVGGESARRFVMGSMKAIHFWAAMIFILSVAARLLWMFAGNPYARWRQFIPTSGERLKGIWETFAFYTFLHRDSPAHVGHNPLAGVAYTLVYTLFLVMIATGLALASANAHVGSFLESFQFLIPWVGGLQLARFVHHIAMWLIIGFVAHHVWSAFLVDEVEKSSLLGSIFTGYKSLTPELAERFRKRMETDE